AVRNSPLPHVGAVFVCGLPHCAPPGAAAALVGRGVRGLGATRVRARSRRGRGHLPGCGQQPAQPGIAAGHRGSSARGTPKVFAVLSGQ
nr:hypothetical protein [Tanacetum cinerariifolium]